MPDFGYFLSCEEHSLAELVDQARMAEQAGFDSLWISDHYHPWNDRQGSSPFVWTVIGALSQAVSLPVETAVTCPLVRTHPAVIAQAAATSAAQLGGRFRLGVGTGEALNEHILGTPWPEASVRLEMLEEALQIIRQLSDSVPCGDDPDTHTEALSAFVEAGFDTVYVNQIGKDQQGFFDFYRTKILPELRG
ncbi:TIGR03557 family F420-dependent LLM class oxidoreductase [Streptomyces sp. NBC_00328]|uniref:TIGR03557 family F420-dependent LLM class oxidoreductase n=1 Tax=Streptomyces sp. NBC_00328 TaxID=2903646 RepID=UPI002E2CE7D8|nr:TIGR03557 family F420-dependent LLM class oxidoreductase [Streptomyces sp. NBC_00328]